MTQRDVHLKNAEMYRHGTRLTTHSIVQPDAPSYISSSYPTTSRLPSATENMSQR